MGWQQILQDPAAHPLAAALDRDEAPPGDHHLVPLPEYGVVSLSGADAVDFLHNQLSNDVAGLGADQSRLAAYCTPKGRMLAALRLYREGEQLRLLLPQALIEPVIKRLRMFVLRSKVALADISAERVVLGAAGPQAAERLQGLGLAVPAEADGVAVTGGWQIIRLRDPQPRYLLIAAPGEVLARLQALQEAFTPAGPDYWRLLDVRAGLPQVLPATQENWVPQTLNLDLLGGVNFRKGCYPGQEVVARMKYLGKLKRRMYRVAVAGHEPPVAGTEVRDAEDRLAGELVLVAPLPQGGAEALAALRMDKLDDALQVGGQPLTVLDLPYEVSAETA